MQITRLLLRSIFIPNSDEEMSPYPGASGADAHHSVKLSPARCSLVMEATGPFLHADLISISKSETHTYT
jgi:hypothetical protein